MSINAWFTSSLATPTPNISLLLILLLMYNGFITTFPFGDDELLIDITPDASAGIWDE